MKIQFNTESAAFKDIDGNENFWDRAEESRRILQEIVGKLFYGYDHGSIMDINGNKIGSWEI